GKPREQPVIRVRLVELLLLRHRLKWREVGADVVQRATHLSHDRGEIAGGAKFDGHVRDSAHLRVWQEGHRSRRLAHACELQVWKDTDYREGAVSAFQLHLMAKRRRA